MATRSQAFRSEEQRRTRAKEEPAPKRTDRSEEHENVHAGKKATYAKEEGVTGRPSRKSTRKSANRAKPDANLNAREALEKGAPTARFRKSQAQARGKNKAA